MIIIEADFNNVSNKRINLSRQSRHANTPFTEIAATKEKILFVDYEEAAFGHLEREPQTGDWFAAPDWASQHQIEPVARRPAYEGFVQRRQRALA